MPAAVDLPLASSATIPSGNSTAMVIADQASSGVSVLLKQTTGLVRSYLSVGSRMLLAMPTPVGLSVAGQRMAAFDLAVVVWVTDALDDAVSAVVIAALMAVLLGISPNVADPHVPIGAV
jgi:hypothetical protein